MANIRKKVKKLTSKKPKTEDIKMTSDKKQSNSLPKSENKKSYTSVIKMQKNNNKNTTKNTAVKNKKSAEIAKLYGLKLIEGGKSLMRKKRFVAIVVCLVLILSFIIFILSTPTGLPEYISNRFATLKSGQDFPIKPEGDKVLYSNTSNDVIFTLTDTNFIGINKNGGEILSFQHGYDNPSAVVSEARCLIYNYKHKKYAVTNYSSKVLSGELKNDIILGTICRNGNFAFLTQSTGYEGQVDVFNKNGDKIYSWFSANQPVSNILLSNDGNSLATVTVSASSGYVKSTISCLKYDSAAPKFKYELNGVVLNLKSHPSGFVAVLSNKIIYYDWNRGEVNSKEFSNDKVSFFKMNQHGDNIIACQKGIITNSYSIYYYKNQNERYSILFNGAISDIDVFNNLIYILSNKKISVINSKNEVIKTYELDNLATSIKVSGGGTVYAYNDTTVFKVE